MALKDCKECGKPVSTQAKACPNCGAKPPQQTKELIVGIVAVAFIIFMAAVIFGDNGNSDDTADKDTTPAKTAPTKTPEQIAAEAQKENRFQITVMAATVVKNSMRDPDSLVWENILANDEATVICMEYRARNGFGGMNREFVVMTQDKTYQTVAAWNKHCTKSMNDMTYVKRAV